MAERACSRFRYSVRCTSSYFNVFMKDSQAALSQGFALRLMLISIPWSCNVAVYSWLAYCTPRSDRWTSLGIALTALRIVLLTRSLLRLEEKFVYLAVIQDAYSRRVIG